MQSVWTSEKVGGTLMAGLIGLWCVSPPHGGLPCPQLTPGALSVLNISSAPWLGPKIQHLAMALPPNAGVHSPNKTVPSWHGGWGVYVHSPSASAQALQKDLWIIRLPSRLTDKPQDPLPNPS